MATNLGNVQTPASVNNMLSRLEATCNELLSEIENKYKLLKASFVKCATEDTKRSRRKSDVRKSVTNIGNTTKSLNLLTEHIDSLGNLKGIYTKHFIVAIRNELEIMWDNCCYGEGQRSSFQPYYSDIFTEEVLQAHEYELRVLKEHYTTNKELYKLVSKREKLWQEKVAFENPADGCSRFENRGGTLIKELKRYQVVEKQLPVTEKEIRLKIKSWEKINKSQFVVQDSQYIKYIETQKLDYKKQQEMKRQAKRAAKQEELLADMSQTLNPVTKRASVYDNSLSKTIYKEISQESLRELTRPTESSLLKMRDCSTPASGLSQLSTTNQTLKRNAPHSKLHLPYKKTSPEEGLPSKLAKHDLSSVHKSPMEHKRRVNTLSTSKLARKENAYALEQSLKSHLPMKTYRNENTGPKRNTLLQTDAMKRKQRRRSLKQTDKKHYLKEKNVTSDFEENQIPV